MPATPSQPTARHAAPTHTITMNDRKAQDKAHLAAVLVGSLVAGLGSGSRPNGSNLRALLPLRRARNQQLPGHPEGDRGYMPAQPKGQPGRDSSANEPHQHREVAESFGADPERCDQARPSCPAALVERIVAARRGPGALAVGCGTGIAARQFKPAGCRVLGVDPAVRMAGLARQSGVGVEVAAFETWDPAGRAFDAVIAGQAWHWVEPVAGGGQDGAGTAPGPAAGGVLERLPPPPSLANAFAEVHCQVMPGAPNLWAGPSSTPAAGQRGAQRPDVAVLCRVPGRGRPRRHRPGPGHPPPCRGVQAPAGGPARAEQAGRDPSHDRAPARHDADVLPPYLDTSVIP